ncbi:MAG: cardiolipin synthase [Lachnospiraceae bacterium]|nr:cardiolipin synthase [Lachnospiraceae bacterium]
MEILELIWEAIVAGFHFFMQNLVFFNFIFAIAVVFFQRKEPKSTWAWLLLLYFIPVLGFMFYLLAGTDTHKRKMFKTKEIEDHLHEAIRKQEYSLRNRGRADEAPDIAGYSDLVLYNLQTSGAVLMNNNDLQIFTDGNEKFDTLIEDIRQAKQYIHIQYYIIKNDVLFNRIKDALIEKVQEGVEVRVLFDAMGCRSVKRSYWKELERQGIKTAEFFPALLRRLHLRINYRNHRKIVVIDGKIGYVGGFNVGKEYIGLDEKFGYWRDTHLRIEGDSALALEVRFILDWNYAAKENLFKDNRYFNVEQTYRREQCDIQILSSGPDSALQNIKANYVRMIHKAEKSIYIQTPYFIPDESMMDALMIAINSGVEVNIMIPCKPDHPFVYWATYSYIGDLVMAGANCYTYNNGFLHAKGIVVDERVMCYGTANMDIRSFALNFEVNAIVYDSGKAFQMVEKFKEDLKVSRQITKQLYASRSLKIRIKEQVCRLLSPVL